jgi:toxin ParE1/3/4
MQFTYTRLAEDDLAEIGAYTVSMWGIQQAIKYLQELEDCCQLIARNPRIGRPWNGIPHGLWRMEQGSHVIFYQPLDAGMIITRILHQLVLPRRRLFDDID